MSLSLKISKKVGGRSDMIASRSWPQNRITVGRGEECTLVLEDPRKHISRVHVELEEKNEGTFHLTIVSKVNPVFVNGKKHAPGSTLDLTAGDRFELGEYELELLPPPAVTPKTDAHVSAVEETTRPDNPQLQMAKKPDPVFEEATFIGQKMPPIEPDPLEGLELPPIEPGLFDEPAVAEAPAAAPAAAPGPEADVFAEATYVGTSAAAPNVFDEATYVGGRPPQDRTVPGVVMPTARPGGASGMRDAVTVFLEGAGLAGKEIRDAELEEFLRSQNQPWRTDSSNADDAFTRNRIRHHLLPILRGYNPSLDQALANLAELARDDEAHWQVELSRILPQVLLPGKPVRGGGRAVSTAPGDYGSVAIEIERLRSFDPALRRRVVRGAARSLGARISFDDTARLLALSGFGADSTVSARPGATLHLPGGLRAERSARELRLYRPDQAKNTQ